MKNKNKKNDYNIGYKKPPKHHQFKKGQSGNPKGRKANEKNTMSILNQELNETVTITEGGRSQTLTKREAMLKHMVNKGVSGDLKAMLFLFGQLRDIDQLELKQEEEFLTEADKVILKRYLDKNKEDK